jgi:hypothetical protein
MTRLVVRAWPRFHVTLDSLTHTVDPHGLLLQGYVPTTLTCLNAGITLRGKERMNTLGGNHAATRRERTTE